MKVGCTSLSLTSSMPSSNNVDLAAEEQGLAIVLSISSSPKRVFRILPEPCAYLSTVRRWTV